MVYNETNTHRTFPYFTALFVLSVKDPDFLDDVFYLDVHRTERRPIC